MLRIVLAATAVAAVATLGPSSLLGPRSAAAYGGAPWCAVSDMGWGDVQWDCSYRSFKACVPFVIAGNRGFCEPNPYWREPAEPRHRKYYRHRR